MTDNVTLLDSNAAEFTAAADFIGSVYYQRIKISWGIDGAAVDASKNNPLPVNLGTLVEISSSKTRPSNTTAYTGGLVINESTSAGTVHTFAGCAAATGGSGTIISATIDDSANKGTALEAELWLYNSSVTGTGNDGAAFTPGDSNKPVAIIPINTRYIGNAASDGSGNCVLESGIVNKKFICAADASLYGVLVARNYYIPVSAEVLNIRLKIVQD